MPEIGAIVLWLVMQHSTWAWYPTTTYFTEDTYQSIQIAPRTSREYATFTPEAKQGLVRPPLPPKGQITCWLEDDDYVRCMDSDGNSRTK